MFSDTDYISEEEKHKVELMLAFLTEESKDAAASTAVSLNFNICCFYLMEKHFLLNEFISKLIQMENNSFI